MTAQIIDGKMISAEVNRENAEKVAFLKSKNITPGLAVILVGDNPASQVYVRAKVKKCEELGIRSFHHVLDKDATMDELLALIERLNKDENVHGILVQSPPPPQIDEQKVIESIVASLSRT